MAVLRKSEVRELGEKEVQEKLDTIHAEIASEQAKISSGNVPDNPGKLAELKRTVARIKTIAKEKGYNIHD